ncbi:Protein kinase, putative [Hondaea fermentalgiana]|uniref:Protein kinase, putative n=1 Tax=Hondaea fermentalgiana TaxID=2315210 RepID=A0A2R5H1W9_9STRA|nr:Protein kinase, putative [Hondaea fermentalgiana]|eukprot:GBG34821.1 Protein kinase, putative [Hondaea fermentalgiana]
MPKSAAVTRRPRTEARSSKALTPSRNLSLNHPALPLRRPRSAAKLPFSSTATSNSTSTSPTPVPPAAAAAAAATAAILREREREKTPDAKLGRHDARPTQNTQAQAERRQAQDPRPTLKTRTTAPALTLSAHYHEVEEESLVPVGMKTLTGEEFRAQFEVGEVLGRGTTSLVRAARSRRSGELYACKVMAKHKISQRARVTGEISIQSKAKHHSLVRLHAVAETSDELLLLVDLALGGDLFERIMQKIRYTEAESRRLMRSLMDALRYLHERGVIHRDVKPENILLTSREVDTNIKLSDFGLAKYLEPARVHDTVQVDSNLVAAAKGYLSQESGSVMPQSARALFGSPRLGPIASADAAAGHDLGRILPGAIAGSSSSQEIDDCDVDDSSFGGAMLTLSSSPPPPQHFELEQMVQGRARAYTSCGTDYYVAPEILLGKGYGPQVDVWSAGVVMYVLLSGSPPFGADGTEDVSVLYRQILIGNVSFDGTVWNEVSPVAKDLIRGMLTLDPAQRVSAAQALSHPWFTSLQEQVEPTPVV